MKSIEYYQARFLDRLKSMPEEGCWEWGGGINLSGYGNTTSMRPLFARMMAPHRMSYKLFVGDFPESLDIDHLCRNRKCCRPDHLEPVTVAENIRRAMAAGSTFGRQTGYRIDACKRGHDLSAPKMLEKYRGRGVEYFRCRACRYLRPSWKGMVPQWVIDLGSR